MPREGEAFFSSAITLKVLRERAAAKSRDCGAFSTANFSAASGRERFRCAIDFRRASTIQSRIVFSRELISIGLVAGQFRASRTTPSFMRMRGCFHHAIRAFPRCQFGGAALGVFQTL